MDAIELLVRTRNAMEVCNKTHSQEIFMDINVVPIDEEIQFDITSSNLVYAYQIQELFNMTVHMEPDGDKIKFSLLP